MPPLKCIKPKHPKPKRPNPHKAPSIKSIPWGKDTILSDPWESDTPEPSNNSREERELAGKEEDHSEEVGDRLFPVELFSRLS